MSPLRRNAENANTWTVVLVFGIIAALYFTREILIPLAFALTLTFLLTPVVNLLERLRIGSIRHRYRPGNDGGGRLYCLATRKPAG